jgi:hypothetical protein
MGLVNHRAIAERTKYVDAERVNGHRDASDREFNIALVGLPVQQLG